MARGFNQCTFIGNLGQDPEIRHLNSGDAVANISVGVSEQWKDRNGDRQDRTEWVRCVAFRKLAEVINEYAKKGMRVFVQGKMQTRKWEDQSGNTRYSTEIVLDQFQMLDSANRGNVRRSERPDFQDTGDGMGNGGSPGRTRPRESGGRRGGGDDGYNGRGYSRGGSSGRPNRNAEQAGYSEAELDFDDDIPFN